MSASSVTKLCQHGITELTEKQDSQKDGTERRKGKSWSWTCQVEELLMKVDNMVKHTAEGFYTSAMFSEAEAIIREEQERMREQGEADGQSASTEAASAGEAAFNTLQQVSAIGTVAVGLGGAAGLTLGAQAVICAGDQPAISSLIKKAQQRMFFLRLLRKLKLPPRMLAQFYTAIIESILTSSITVWYAGATVRDRLRLQRVVRAAEKVIGCRLPSILDLYISRTRRCAGQITANPSHPGHGLFSPLPSGRRLRSIRTKTSRYMNSFFPSAIRLLNTK
ncbi:hypothetical protein D4764_18G0001640 [Takifugu flavidus]|uniref:Alkylated DNA repair protein AlkB homologue 8 N-terminal domain-containing protein n=1 Tax=Takifugu flavidus TaxID=433684 RepID=A0A5C6NRK0_9TELE|nr:hypothetical protein D4764_18G0001640 [Takifugu flavidus]